MKLVIFGSTGGVGRQLVEQALEQRHTVTAFARNPAKLPTEHENLQIVQGDVNDVASVEQAIRGQEAVLAALGSSPFKNTTVRSEGNRQIIRAMGRAGVRRLVSLSTLGVGDSWETLPFKYKVLFRTLLRKAFDAHVEQENLIKQSGLDWTIVRPGEYTDGGRTGKYRNGFPVTDRTIKAKISRADVADFMLKQLTNNEYLRKTPGLSY
jgi:putative NADH-flavin reductase